MGFERIGPYRIESILGQGGMGEVFLARDEKLRRQVAIKRIRADLPCAAEQRARFRREALAAARLCHPSIVQIYELLETADGDCLVMERVEGRSLAELVAAGGLELRQVLRLGREIAEGLAEAHGKGLIHRDLKPENVLVSRGGHAKIVDFGLARMLWSDGGEDTSGSGLTEAGLLVGTVHAMSPEQASGQELDHRSDLFALGSLLYEMLTGRAPFRGENWLDSLRRVNAEAPPPLVRLRPELPPALVELVEQLLAKKREKRPANARLVAEALERIAAGPLPAAGSTAAPALTPPLRAASLLPAAGPALATEPTGAWQAPPEGRGETALRTLLRVELPAGRPAAPPEEPARAAAAQLEMRQLRDLVSRHGGIEVEKGEALLALFERPADAVACALAFQRLRAEPFGEPSGGTPPARLAIHLGELLLVRPSSEEQSRGARPLEVEGAAKGMAARLAALGRDGQILLSQAAFDLARRAAAPPSGVGREQAQDDERLLCWLAHGSYFFPAAEERIEVFEVGWRGLAPLAAPADGPAARRLLSPSEERLLGWRPAAGQSVPLRPHWRLAERIGEGGFGEVWLARHKAGEKRVFKFCFEVERLRALKREVTLFRLLKEALGHRDDIARILDWQFDEAPYFIESEYTEAGNLVQWAEAEGGIGAVPLTTRLALAAEVAEALGAAHSVGILHKDVKPENVLIGNGRDGRPQARLADFGIGRLASGERLAERLGARGLTPLGFSETLGSQADGAGTLLYLAPEIVEGKAPSIQGDIYSWGVLVYQLAVGDLGRTLAPGWERDVGDGLLVEDLARFVDGRPERRPASAREAAQRLRTLEPRRAARAAEAARRQSQIRSARRRRWLGWSAAASLAVLAIVSVMALREHRAREAAEAAERRAALRRGQAEELLDFLLGDLRTRLTAVGRLDLLDAVGKEAMEYFAAVPPAELSDAELARRSKALYQIGEVRVGQGQLPAARQAFEQAVRLSEALAARAPDDEQLAFELAQSRFWLGSVDLDQGRPQVALDEFASYLAIAEREAGRFPESRNWQMEVAYATSSLAAVHQSLGNLQLAETQIRRSIAIKKSVLAAEPANTEWRKSLANGLAWLSQHLRSRGRLRAAVEIFRSELELRETLLAEDPRNPLAKSFLTITLGNFGEVLLDTGDLPGAEEVFRREMAMVTAISEQDPAHRTWQRDLAVAHGHLAEIASVKGVGAADFHLDRAERIFVALLKLDGTNASWRQLLGENHLRAAEHHLRHGMAGRAALAAHSAATLLVSLHRPEEKNSRLFTLTLRAQLVLGRSLLAQGRMAEAHAAFEQARNGVQALPPNADVSYRNGWIQTLFELGRRPEAAVELRLLREDGYAHPDFVKVATGLGL